MTDFHPQESRWSGQVRGSRGTRHHPGGRRRGRDADPLDAGERGSAAHQAAERFAESVAEATDRRIQIQVRPASELGDWPEVHEGVVDGAVDLALQPLSTQFDARLAIAWFPYTVQDYASAREAFAEGGYIFEAVDAMLEGGAVKILAPYAIGMGGAGFTSGLREPRNADASMGCGSGSGPVVRRTSS